MRTLLVALIGLVLSAFAWVATARWEDRIAEAEFATAADNHLVLLQAGFADFADALRSFHGFIEGAAGKIDRQRLNQYATPLVEKYKGLSDLAWVARVAQAERSEFETAARRSGLAEYRIFRPGGRREHTAPADQADYYPILYVTPEHAYREVIGTDLGSQPLRWAALEQARDGNELVASRPPKLLVGAPEPGFIAVQPVYAGQGNPATIEERRRNLVGFALGAYRLSEMVDGILARLVKPAGLNVYVYEDGAAADALPIYVHTSRSAKASAAPLRMQTAEAGLHAAGVVTFGRRSWAVVLVPTEQRLFGLWRLQALGKLAAGLLLTGFATADTRKTIRRRRRENVLALELGAATDRLRTIFDSVNDGIFVSDPNTGKFVDVNPAGCEMFGYTHEDLLGRDIVMLSSGAPPYSQSEAIEWFTKAQSNGPQKFEWRAKAKDGNLFWVEVSLRCAAFAGRDFAVAALRDVTERKRADAQILQMARYDSLTGLANRRLFAEALQLAMKRKQRGGRGFAVLYLDLDHFKDVNDTLGHPVGDLLLKSLAERLRGSVRETDVVARFGGDEFAILQTDINEAVDAGVLATKILETISKPFPIDGNEIHSGSSIGIAVYGPDAPSVETLLAHADVALYRAKAEGRGTYRFFTDAMDAEVRTRVTLCAELREAVDKQQLVLFYQPQVDSQSGRIIGLEALVYWRHPDRGIVPPGEFIPAAEENGVIVAIGRWVIREACRQAKTWLDAGIAPEAIAVNLSTIQLKTPLELEKDIVGALSETGLPARRLELELTESVLMETAREHNDTLLRLRRSGMRIAIDDFGTGYSSLDYLRRFPVDRIKIARNFVRGLGTNTGSAAIVKATLGLARELGLGVIAEGVETEQQLKLLKSWGCRDVQGYYFSKPLPAAEVTLLLRRGRIVPAQPIYAEAV